MFKTKKLLKGAAAVLLSAGLLAVSAAAYTGAASVKVSSGYLNLRQSGSTSAKVTGKLYNGLEVTVQSTTGGWAKVSYYGGTGWVSAQYLTLGDYVASSNSKIQTAVDTAKRVIGVKYAYGGASVSSGFDCSGLAVYSFSKAGVTLPHSAAQQAKLGTAVSRANLRAGDVVFFDTDGGLNNITHEGVYIGSGQFIDAESGTLMRVNLTSLSNSYWSSVYMTARRYIS